MYETNLYFSFRNLGSLPAPPRNVENIEESVNEDSANIEKAILKCESAIKGAEAVLEGEEVVKIITYVNYKLV